MIRNRLLKTLVGLVALVVAATGIGYHLFATPATRTILAAPACSMAMLKTAELSASEVYYAQQFMPRDSCADQPVSNVSPRVLLAMPTLPGLSASEVYYAQKAQRFIANTTPEDLDGLPQ